jgi:6-phosphofructokinase 2
MAREQATDEESFMEAIVTLTMNPAVDKSSQVHRVAPDQKLSCDRPEFHPGGGGINVARVIHRLGGAARALYLCGGTSGDLLQRLLDEEEIDQQPIHMEGRVRENFTVLEESSGQQYRFGMPGPEVKEEEWQRVLDQLGEMVPKADYIVASGSLPPGVPDDFYARIAKMANETKARLIVDTKGAPLQAAVEQGLYLIKPNMRELGMIAGHEIEDEEEQEEVARSLVEQGQCEVVVVSLGAAGALYATRDTCERLRAPSVSIKSKVGAGDSMVGGMVLALAQEKSVREAVQRGIATGAAAVTTPGTELCRADEAEHLYREIQKGE